MPINRTPIDRERERVVRQPQQEKEHHQKSYFKRGWMFRREK